MDIDALYELYKQNSSVVTDTRKIKKGDVFFALKGPIYNGNEYAKQALDLGAAFCIVDELVYEEERIILVNDALDTLQQLAKKHRSTFNIPFLAITGSNGKTTTKELIHAVLSTRYITSTTIGNLNNHIGIPLTILSIPPNAEIAIIEMGANHLHEIRGYCTYANPTHGLITNIGKAHIEGFGSEEGVKKAKGELFDHLRNANGTAFVFADQPALLDLSKAISKVIMYGTDKADVAGRAVSTGFQLEVLVGEGLTIKTKLTGDYNLPNVLAAVTVGRFFKVDDADIKYALESYAPTNSRSQLIEQNSNKIIMDAYNANPSSMKAAIENFAGLPGNKILILGGMMEMGENSLEEHATLVKLINQYKWKQVVLVGKDFTDLPQDFLHFDSSLSAREWYKKQVFTDTSILVKGSRSLQMEKVLQD